MSVMTTTLGRNYPADAREYVDKETTQGRTRVMVRSPNGHLIRVAVSPAGTASYCFSDRYVKERKWVHMRGKLVHDLDSNPIFIPDSVDHFNTLYNWERERIPAQVPRRVRQKAHLDTYFKGREVPSLASYEENDL